MGVTERRIESGEVTAGDIHTFHEDGGVILSVDAVGDGVTELHLSEEEAHRFAHRLLAELGP